MLRSSQLDNCNGKFTYNPSTGKYTYAYYGQCPLPLSLCSAALTPHRAEACVRPRFCDPLSVTTNATYYNFPYVVGCYGPGTFWKNGTKIDYTPIKGKIDTSCT
jgi:hypothetical protein